MLRILLCAVVLMGVTAPTSHAMGVVTFTFDDTTRSQYEYAFPTMQNFDIVGTMFAISREVDIASRYGGKDPSHLTWDELKVMRNAGWDIQSHTHSHVDLTKLDNVSLYGELGFSKEMIGRKIGKKPVALASPFGAFNEHTLSFVKMHYRAHFRAWGGNQGFNDLENLDLYDLGRYEVKHTYTAEKVCATIEDAGASNVWLVLEFHKVVPDEASKYEVSMGVFERIVQCAAALERRGTISIQTASEVINQTRE